MKYRIQTRTVDKYGNQRWGELPCDGTLEGALKLATASFEAFDEVTAIRIERMSQ